MTHHCEHQFFGVKYDSLFDRAGQEISGSIHAIVVCAYCGQVRHVYPDGAVVIVKQHGIIRHGKTE